MDYKNNIALPRNLSYGIMAGILLGCGFFHLAVPLLVALFAFFALTLFDFTQGRHKWVSVSIFTIILIAVALALTMFIKQTLTTMPTVADKAIPSFIEMAEKYGLEVPFTDYTGLKQVTLDYVKEQIANLKSFTNIARTVSMQTLFIIIGCVVAVSIFLNARFELDSDTQRNPNNLYSRCGQEVTMRFGTFFESFRTVMGAQILISLINTALTGIFVVSVQLPHPVVVIGVTFLCGLLPVIGNLVSNTIIVSIGLTVSPEMAMLALAFLVLIHKLEYFLNSKIIGTRIRNPLWLTLLGLVLGEKLMGIPGMILAPVVLHYIKIEVSKFTVRLKEDGEQSSEM